MLALSTCRNDDTKNVTNYRFKQFFSLPALCRCQKIIQRKKIFEINANKFFALSRWLIKIYEKSSQLLLQISRVFTCYDSIFEKEFRIFASVGASVSGRESGREREQQRQERESLRLFSKTEHNFPSFFEHTQQSFQLTKSVDIIARSQLQQANSRV
jgi:hypothetical protein